jgi:group I intron endonuclease
MFIIYLATCLENNKVYVGQTCKRLSNRRWAHVNRKDYDGFFNRAIRKYGAANFDWQILSHAETKDEANNLERVWIALFQSMNREFGYNMTAGGDGSIGHKHSAATREKHSIAMKKFHAAGLRKPRSGWKWSHPRSEESCRNVSNALKARPRQEKKLCKVEGCLRYTHAHGFCCPHAGRFKRYGDPTAGQPLGVKGPKKGIPYGPRVRQSAHQATISLTLFPA